MAKIKDKDLDQSKRFIKAAKKAGADETEEGADRAFKKVAKFSPVRRGEKKTTPKSD